jgi:hypothetical protein
MKETDNGKAMMLNIGHYMHGSKDTKAELINVLIAKKTVRRTLQTYLVTIIEI